jgi:hypothetical protein
MKRLVATLALASTACGLTSTYQPSNTPMARIVAEEGEQFLVVGADRRSIGPMMGDLDVALREVPAAAELAVQASDLATRGLVLTLVGATAAIAGIVTLFTSDRWYNDGFSTREGVGLGLAVVGFSVELYGATLTPKAAFLANDAINLYNDTIWARQGAAPAPVSP